MNESHNYDRFQVERNIDGEQQCYGPTSRFVPNRTNLPLVLQLKLLSILITSVAERSNPSCFHLGPEPVQRRRTNDDERQIHRHRAEPVLVLIQGREGCPEISRPCPR